MAGSLVSPVRMVPVIVCFCCCRIVVTVSLLPIPFSGSAKSVLGDNSNDRAIHFMHCSFLQKNGFICTLLVLRLNFSE